MSTKDVNRLSILSKIRCIDKNEEKQFYNYGMVQKKIEINKIKEIFFVSFSTLKYEKQKIKKIKYEKVLNKMKKDFLKNKEFVKE